MSYPPPWCKEYVGLPFKEKGRGPGGFDCWGLVREVSQVVFGNYGLPDYSDAYTSAFDKHSVAAAVRAGLAEGWEQVDGPAPGVLVILRLEGNPWHCAIALDSKWFLHVHKATDSVTERFESLTWRNKVEGFYRCKQRS